MSSAELSLMCQAGSMSRRRPGTPAFAYSECLWADQSRYAYLVNALDVLLFPWRLWEGLVEQDCCPSTCSAEAGVCNTVIFLFKSCFESVKTNCTSQWFTGRKFPTLTVARTCLQGFLQ